jgi:hypothetical protein
MINYLYYLNDKGLHDFEKRMIISKFGILYHISMIDICDSDAIFKLSKRRKIENSWTLECTHILGKTAEQFVVKWSNARRGRQIPAYIRR